MKVNQLKAGVILSYSSMILGYVIAIVYTPIMLRLLGQSEYGLYNLVASVVSYLGLLSFGFGSAYVRFYSRYKVEDNEREIAKLNGMFMIIFSVIGVIAVLAGLVLVANTESIFGEKLLPHEMQTAKILMAIMVFNIALSFPASVFNSYITANEKYVFQKLIQMIKTVVSPFVMLPVLLMGYKSVGMVVVTTLLTIVVKISNAVFCFKRLNMKFSFREFDFALMKEMIVFSSYIFLDIIVDQINWNVDKFLLGRFRGTVAVATYGLAAQLNSYYISLASTITGVFIPKVNRMVASGSDDSELTRLFTRVGRIQFMVLSLVSSGLVFFGEPFIMMWAGSEYRESFFIFLMLVLPLSLPLVQTLGIHIQRAKNMHQFRSLFYLLMAICNLVISIPLTKVYGGVGAALGTGIGQIIGNTLVMNIYYHRVIGLDMRYFWKNIAKLVPALIAPCFAGSIVVSKVNVFRPAFFFTSGFVYVVVFGISMWFIGMNESEKDLVRVPLRKIFLGTRQKDH